MRSWSKHTHGHAWNHYHRSLMSSNAASSKTSNTQVVGANRTFPLDSEEIETVGYLSLRSPPSLEPRREPFAFDKIVDRVAGDEGGTPSVKRRLM